MLTKYNLNIGSNQYPNEFTYGIQDENVLGYKDGYTMYGNVVFSSVDYWSSGVYSPAGNSSYNYIYDSNSNLYQYVSAYETYLKNILGVSSARATLISYEQLENLNCSGNNYSCSNAPDWVYSTTYFTGSIKDLNYVWSVYSNADFDGRYDYGNNYTYGGVRPVITVSAINIKN